MQQIIDKFINFLLLERSLSENTAIAYRQDINKLFNYFKNTDIDPMKATAEDMQNFVNDTFRNTKSAKTQARILSGIKAFYHYLVYTNQIDIDPTILIPTPQQELHLPSVLTIQEIDNMLAQIDLSKPEGHRNQAIIEMLYGSGLRVSELVGLKLSNINWDENYMLIEGKGSKQRLVPISPTAKEKFMLWYHGLRAHLDIEQRNNDYAFLNRLGKPLTRVMVFYIIKDLAARAGINKNISPHTLRHSFATHLMQNGADIRIIQQLLGHESITTTEIYTHIDITDLRDAINMYHPANQIKR